MVRRNLVLITVLCLVLGLSGCATSARQSQVAGTLNAPAPVVITQAEAEAVFSSLAQATGGSFKGMKKRRSQTESATLSAMDLSSVIASGYEDYALQRAEEAELMNASDKPGTSGWGPWLVGGALANPMGKATTNPDLFNLAWDGWFKLDSSDSPSGGDEALAAREMLSDLLAPALAGKYAVTVEPSGTVDVTYPSTALDIPMPWFNAQDVPEWTNKYVFEKRDGGWVIVSAPALGSYHTAVVKELLKNSKPSDAEIEKALGDAAVKWKGQDNDEVWWTAVLFKPDGLGDVYASLGYRDMTGRWISLGSGAPDGRIQIDDSYKVPKEVVAALKKADVPLFEQ